GQARPWIGVYTETVRGHVIVTQVLRGGPAADSGLQRGDVILSVGSERVATQSQFYTALWASGGPGVSVTLQVLRDQSVHAIVVQSKDRMDFLRPWSTSPS